MKKKLILIPLLVLVLVVVLITPAVGCAGEQGLKGSTGPAGPQGIQGEQGEPGPMGLQGKQGPVGLQGEQGEYGMRGSAGSKGATGATGAKGEQGEEGPRGSSGSGSTGAAGATGAAGPKGPVGPEGPAGKDAEFPTPTIDGAITLFEWYGATIIPVASEMGTVFVIAYTDCLYVLFDVVDSTDARTDYEFEVGNDQISINVNPTAGISTWGFPYDLIFETSALSVDDGGHHVLPWNPKVNSGTIDGWATRWFPDDAQQDLPDNLESATIYSDGRRITEWKLPLTTTAPSLKVGGAIDVGDGHSYVYPISLDWNNPGTFVNVDVLVR